MASAATNWLKITAGVHYTLGSLGERVALLSSEVRDEGSSCLERRNGIFRTCG